MFLLDENIPIKLKDFLIINGFKCITIFDIGLDSCEDNAILNLTLKNGYVLVTFDDDFERLFYYSFNKTFGIILVKRLKQDLQHLFDIFSYAIKEKVLNDLQTKGNLIVLYIDKIEIFSHGSS